MVSVLIFPRLFLNTIFTLIEWDYVVGKTAGKAINLFSEKHAFWTTNDAILLSIRYAFVHIRIS